MRSKKPVLFAVVFVAMALISCGPKPTVQPFNPTPLGITIQPVNQTPIIQPWNPTTTADYSFIRAVNKTDDHDDGTCDAADCTLREAINWANVVKWALIQFNLPGPGYNVLTLQSPLPVISAPIVIDEIGRAHV